MEDLLKQILSEMKDFKEQQKENTDIIKAIIHNQEVANAELEALKLNTPNNAVIAKLDNKLDRISADVTFLVRKAAEHEDDIRNLKLIK